MQLKVNEAWLRGLQGQERDQMKKMVVDSEKLLDKLKEILYNMRESRETISSIDYDNPSWSHKQAHLNGEAAIIRKLEEILSVKERSDQTI